MFTSPDALRINDIRKLPRFEFHTSVGEGDKIKPVKLVCYGKLPNGEYVRDRGNYLVETMFSASGKIVGQNVKAELLDPNK